MAKSKEQLFAIKELAAIEAAREDPNAFIDYLNLPDPTRKGEKLRQSDCHKRMQNFLSENQFALVEMPRFHGKTTQVRLRAIWELGKNNQLVIAYVCQNDRQAVKRVNGIRKILQGPLGPRIRKVFPNLVIDTKQPDRESQFTLIRDGDQVDPSLYAMGITGSGTGNRAGLLILDDIVSPKNSNSEIERDKVYDRVTDDLLQFIDAHDRCWNIFTPWHEDDANARLVKMSRDHADRVWSLLAMPVGENFEPVWPERRDAKWLKAKLGQIGARAYSQGYLLRVISESDMVFDRLTFFDYDAWQARQSDPNLCIPTRKYVAIDPAFTAKTYSDYTGMVAGEIGSDPTIYMTKAQKIKVADSDLVSAIADFADAVGTRIIFIEQAGQGQRLLLEMLRKEGKARHGEAYIVIGVRPKQGGAAWTDKKQRNSQLSPFFADGTVRIAGRKTAGGWEPVEWMEPLVRQMRVFTGVGNGEDDLVDAACYLAYALTTQLWARCSDRAMARKEKVLNIKEQYLADFKTENDPETREERGLKKLWGWNS